MKASRAPGPVSYTQLHNRNKSREGQQGVRAMGNAPPKGKSEAKSAANISPQGGVVRKAMDLDEIPDISWDSVGTIRIQPTAPSVSQSSFMSRGQHRNDQQYGDDDDDDEYVRADQDDGDDDGYWAAPTQHSPPKRSIPPFPSDVGKQPKASPKRASPRRHNMHSYSNDGSDSGEDSVPVGYSKKQPARLAPSLDDNKAIPLVISSPSKKKNGKISFSEEEAKSAVAALPSKGKAAAAQPAVVTGLQIRTDAPPPLPYEQSISQEQRSPSKMTDQEKLFYTKQPRHVEYKPYTLKQYQMIRPKEYVEIGNIQPDLNTEELIAKRRNLDRIKQFSKQLRQYNREVLTQQPKLPSATEQNDLRVAQTKYQSNRQRALEFAKNVPKPKGPQATALARIDEAGDEHRRSERRNSSAGEYASQGPFMDEDDFRVAKLQELEARHQNNRARMESIKKSLHV